MKRYPTRLKLLLLLLCAIVAMAVGATSYAIKWQKLTPWQKEQIISFEKQTGSTKFKAIIDSSINASVAFCITAITLTTSYKFYNKNKK